MLKALTITTWALFALEAVVVLVLIGARNMGDDAAGRNLALFWGLLGLAILLLPAGLGLYFAGRAKSLPGVIACLCLLALPFLIFGADWLYARYHDLQSYRFERQMGRFPDPAQRQLAQAMRAGDLVTMRRILAAHPNLQGRDPTGFDLLGLTVEEIRTARSPEARESAAAAVQLLLEAGMDPNQAEDCYGYASFPKLAQEAPDPIYDRVFRLFLEHGANPNTIYFYGPPAFYASENPDHLRALLEHGAGINIRDKGGDTPLLFYVRNHRWPAARLMLEHGADIGVRNNAGETVESALEDNRKTAEEAGEPLPEDYYQVAAIVHRRAAPKQ